MNDLIPINYENETPTVSGRELHKALEVKTAYKDWFPRMCEYGFDEGRDFNPLIFEQVRTEGNREVSREITDHQLTIPMAKELCMLQRNEKGKQFRQYFIQIEEAWNSPEMVMGRALRLANKQIETLTTTVSVQEQQISELQPKANYYDIVLNCPDLVPISVIAKDYGWTANQLNKYLKDKKVQFRQKDIWLLYKKYAEKGYTSTKTFSYEKDGETRLSIHTYWTQKGRLFIYHLLESDGVLPIMEREKQ